MVHCKKATKYFKNINYDDSYHNFEKCSKNHEKSSKYFEKILQIAYLVPKMNSPWLEYEKWYITSWYTVKPDFAKFCRIFPEKNQIPDPEKRIPGPEIYLC